MEKLNKMEVAIVQAIVKENKQKYPFLEDNLSYLYVKNRRFTGVGAFTHFVYSKEYEHKNVNGYLYLSSNKALIIQGCKHEISYELNITDGRIDFLEIVTNGDDVLSKNEIMYDFKLI